MPITKRKCDWCKKVYPAYRKTSHFCSNECYTLYWKDLKKQTNPRKGATGYPGIYWDRVYTTYKICIDIGKEKKEWKYIGSRKKLEDAIQFQKDILNG